MFVLSNYPHLFLIWRAFQRNYEMHRDQVRFPKEESALLFKSNLNESVSVKVAHVCSWHIIYRGTLFNGPLTSCPIRLQDGV